MKRIANYLIVLTLAVFAFTSCEDVPSPFGQIVAPKSDEGEVIEPSGKGTLAEPYNVAGVIEYLSGLGADVPSPTDVYIKGVITSITEAFGTQYGNATFEISDTENASNKFLCYRVKYLGNTSYSDPSALNIKQGNTVIICGKVVNYKGNTPETSANAAYVYSINGQGGSGGGGGDTPSGDLGTKDAPLTVAQALAAINKLADGGETGDAYVKGIISKVQSFNATYKSITYYISDNGKETSELQVYSGKGLNGADFAAKEDLAAGDIVVVKGKLKKYVKGDVVTPEINQSSEIISLTKGSGGGGGGTGEAKGTGTANDPFNIAAAIAKCKEVGTTASTEKYYIKGYVVKGGKASGGYGNVTFDMGDTKDATELFKAYQVAGSDGEKLADGYEVKAGSEVVIYGPVVTYNTTYETAGKSAAQIVTIDGKKTNDTGGGGGATGGDGSASKPFNIAEAIAKCQQIGETASTEKYYVKGIVVTGGKVSGGYGNVTFKMGDTKDATELFTAYQVAGTDGEKLADGFEVKAGSEVVIYGPLVNYKGNTPETSGKSAAQIVTIDGKKTNEGSGGGGGTGGTGADGSTIISVADFNAAAESTSVWYQLTGTVKNLKDGDIYGNFDLEDSTGSVYVYGLLSTKGGEKKKFQDLVKDKGIANGKKITIVGNRGSYQGKIEVTNAYFIKIE